MFKQKQRLVESILDLPKKTLDRDVWTKTESGFVLTKQAE